jgi:hypothetical protein
MTVLNFTVRRFSTFPSISHILFSNLLATLLKLSDNLQIIITIMFVFNVFQWTGRHYCLHKITRSKLTHRIPIQTIHKT